MMKGYVRQISHLNNEQELDDCFIAIDIRNYLFNPRRVKDVSTIQLCKQEAINLRDHLDHLIKCLF